jgi:hypothetical protein
MHTADREHGGLHGCDVAADHLLECGDEQSRHSDWIDGAVGHRRMTASPYNRDAEAI